LAKDLLKQIRGDSNPTHFTLAEVKQEYAALSSTDQGTPVLHDECFQLLKETGLIGRNKDGGYYVGNSRIGGT